MSMRVTDQTIYAANSASLQSALASLATAQQRASTGLAISKPSDDPSGTVAVLGINASIAANTQYSRNISDGQSWTAATDGALTQTSTLLRQARDLLVQASNGTNNSSSLGAIATQLQGIKQALMTQANTQVGGRTVFAGTADTGSAFSASTTPPYTFAGTSPVMRRVADGQTVRVDVDGSQVFGSGSGSIFSQLDGVISTLQSGSNAVQSGITMIDGFQSQVGIAQAQVGASINSLSTAAAGQQSNGVSLTKQQSDIMNVDIAQAAIALTNQQNVYQAALLVTANTAQTNLADYLK